MMSVAVTMLLGIVTFTVTLYATFHTLTRHSKRSTLYKTDWCLPLIERLADVKSQTKPGNVQPKSRELAEEIGAGCGYVLRDFVLAWFRALSGDDEFPGACENLLHSLARGLCVRARTVDAPHAARKATYVFAGFYSAYSTVRDRHALETDPGVRARAVVAEVKRTWACHPALRGSHATEHAYLRCVAGRLLDELAPGRPCLDVEVSTVFARELLATNVLRAVVDLLEDPDFLCEAISLIVSNTEEEAGEEAAPPHAPCGRDPPTITESDAREPSDVLAFMSRRSSPGGAGEGVAGTEERLLTCTRNAQIQTLQDNDVVTGVEAREVEKSDGAPCSYVVGDDGGGGGGGGVARATGDTDVILSQPSHLAPDNGNSATERYGESGNLSRGVAPSSSRGIVDPPGGNASEGGRRRGATADHPVRAAAYLAPRPAGFHIHTVKMSSHVKSHALPSQGHGHPAAAANRKVVAPPTPRDRDSVETGLDIAAMLFSSAEVKVIPAPPGGRHDGRPGVAGLSRSLSPQRLSDAAARERHRSTASVLAAAGGAISRAGEQAVSTSPPHLSSLSPDQQHGAFMQCSDRGTSKESTVAGSDYGRRDNVTGNNDDEAPFVAARRSMSFPTMDTLMSAVTAGSPPRRDAAGRPVSCISPGEDYWFKNVRIDETETVGEAVSYQLQKPYVVYCIKYDLCIPSPTAVGGSEVCYRAAVRRRFREFVNLQSRLDKHPEYRKYVKGLRGPKRWVNIPFSNLGWESVELRRYYLEEYLKELCVRPVICISSELREFLACGTDASLAYVNDVPEYVPRIDKMLVRTMTDMIDVLREALPDLPGQDSGATTQVGRSDKTSAASQYDPHTLKLQYHVATETTDGNSSKDVMQYKLRGSMIDFLCANIRSCSDDENFTVATLDMNEHRQRYAVKGPALDDEIPLISSFLDLGALALARYNHWLCQTGVVRLLYRCFGRLLERWLHLEIGILTSKERCAYTIHLLLDAIWPGGKLSNGQRPIKTEEQLLATKQKTVEDLINFFPDLLPVLVGKSTFHEVIEMAVESLQHRMLNRHLIYYAMDVLTDALTNG